ncbi:hypothetical protein E4T56_gene17464 [Termitomyces sp. T112]|nr:hypothetical protein E4T56_gene17464 [Termitomyces sp. T112]
MAPGVVCPIPMGSRVVQADVMPEYFAEAAGQARGPPTLEWCQAVALCASCTQRGEQCEFEEPVPGVRRDTSNRGGIANGLQCSWRRVGGVGSQGGVLGWRGGVGVGRPPMKIGPPWGGWREGAPTTHDKGKWKASPLPEVGPSKQAWGELALAGPPSPTVYSPTSGTLVEPSVGGSWSIIKALLWRRAEELERLLATRGEEVRRVGEERDRFWRELDKARREWDLASSRVASAHEAVGGMGAGGGAMIGGVGDVGNSAGAQCRGDPSDGREGAAVGRVACQRGGLGAAGSALLGQGALHPP